MILKSLIFINGFALFIGLLILFLDSVISRYGTVSITLNGEKEFKAEGGKIYWCRPFNYGLPKMPDSFQVRNE